MISLLSWVSGLCLGFTLRGFYDNYIYKKSIKEKYYKYVLLLKDIDLSKCIYEYRFNNYILIKYLNYEIKILMDKKSITITEGDNILLTDIEMYKNELEDCYIKFLLYFNNEIHDTIEYEGNLIYRQYFTKKFNSHIILKDNYTQDELLDKVLRDGIDSLTDEEKEFLKNSEK